MPEKGRKKGGGTFVYPGKRGKNKRPKEKAKNVIFEGKGTGGPGGGETTLGASPAKKGGGEAARKTRRVHCRKKRSAPKKGENRNTAQVAAIKRKKGKT